MDHRKWHRRVAPWVAVPLLVSLTTGIAYRTGRAWFHLDDDLGDRLLDIHAGSWLGATGSLVYILLAGCGLLAVVASGTWMLFQTRSGRGVRYFHRAVAGVFFAPLAATALTGILYKLGQEWMGFPDSVLSILMAVHQGTWLGMALRPWYVVLVGTGLIFLIASGVRILRKPRRIRWS